jgi:hypothetical protein
MLLCFYSSSRCLRMLNLHLQQLLRFIEPYFKHPHLMVGVRFHQIKTTHPLKNNQSNQIKHFTVNHTYELSPQGLPQNLLSLLIVSNQPNSQVVIRSCIPIPPVIIKQISHDWILMAIISFFYPTPKFFNPIWIPIFNPYFSHS